MDFGKQIRVFATDYHMLTRSIICAKSSLALIFNGGALEAKEPQRCKPLESYITIVSVCRNLTYNSKKLPL
jgi:hypothetical protein